MIVCAFLSTIGSRQRYPDCLKVVVLLATYQISHGTRVRDDVQHEKMTLKEKKEKEKRCHITCATQLEVPFKVPTTASVDNGTLRALH